MPKSTMGGSDPFHDLPKSEKDRIEKEMRKIAKEKFDQKKERDEILQRARNISRTISKSQQHH